MSISPVLPRGTSSVGSSCKRAATAARSPIVSGSNHEHRDNGQQELLATCSMPARQSRVYQKVNGANSLKPLLRAINSLCERSTTEPIVWSSP